MHSPDQSLPLMNPIRVLIPFLVILVSISGLRGEDDMLDDFFDEGEFLSDSASKEKDTAEKKETEKGSEGKTEGEDEKRSEKVLKTKEDTIQFDTLCGKLPKVIKGDNRYIVTCDIIVPSNRLVTVEKGAVFLFKDFTGVHVEGKLHCKGTKKRPIVFTSVNDPGYNPYSMRSANPFDWNGIVVHNDAFGTLFEYVKVSYSVYGLATKTKFIRIDPGIFKHNGESDIVKDDKKIKVDENPYEYILSLKDAKVDGVRVNLLKDPMAPRRNIMRYTGLAAFIGGGILGAIQTKEYLAAQEEYKESAKTDPENLQYGSSEEFKKNEEAVQKTGTLSIVGYSTALLGALSFAISFSF